MAVFEKGLAWFSEQQTKKAKSLNSKASIFFFLSCRESTAGDRVSRRWYINLKHVCV